VPRLPITNPLLDNFGEFDPVNLVNPYSFATAGGFSPLDITGCELWLKADALSLSDGDPVSSWTDSSGNSNHATMTGGDRPTFQTNELNSLPGVASNSETSGWLNLTTPITNARTVFIVARHRDGNQDWAHLIGDTTTNNYFHGGLGTALHSTTFSAIHGVCAADGWTDGVSTSIGSMAKSAAGVVYSYDMTAADAAVDQLFNNANQQALSRVWDGFIFELIVYDNRLSTGDRESVEDYLGIKYGITITH
jgi:hypothetical protein